MLGAKRRYEKKEILAFLLSPLAPVIVFCAGIFIWSIGFSELELTLYKSIIGITPFAMMSAIVSYIVTLLIALPFYYEAKGEQNYLSKITIFKFSIIIGGILMSLISFLFGANEIIEIGVFAIIGMSLGFTFGYTFWFIIRKSLTRKSNGTNDT